MGHQYPAGVLAGSVDPGHHGRHRGLLVVDVVVVQLGLDPGRLEEGQGEDLDRAVIILDHEGGGGGLEGAGDVQTPGLQQAGAEADALGGVVVAGDEHHRDLEPEHHVGEEAIEQLDRLLGGHRAIVDVARQQQGVGAVGGYVAAELVQRMLLILEQALAVEHAPQVEIGGVDEAGHGSLDGVRAGRTS